MKKLIALAAIATCGAALAVESANIVGYQNKELNENANAFVAQTLIPCGVTAADVTLDDFVPTSGADGWDYTSDFLATLKTNGNLDKKYGYLSPYWAAKYWTADEAGWYDYSLLSEEEQTASDELGATTKIPFGTGFLVYTAGSSVTITFSGEVLQDEVALALNENANTFVGNATPAAVNLADIAPTSGADGWDYTSDFLATLKTNGNLDKKYGYLSPYWAAKYWTADEAGWYDYSLLSEEEQTASDEIKGDSVQFAPGAGFLVYTAGSDIELVLPSPL